MRLPSFFALCALAALLLPGGCTIAPDAVANHIVILHTNDLHGQVLPRWDKTGGMSALAAQIRILRKQEEARGAKVILVDCGDFFQGTPEGDLPKGELMVDIMNELGYDALCLGNHDFDFGLDVLGRLARRARFPFLGTNIAGDRPDFIQSSATIHGHTFIGIITPDMPTLTAPHTRKGLRFEDPIHTIRRYPDAIVLSHCGSERERAFKAPLVLGGHSHESISDPKNRYQQTGGRAGQIGIVRIGPDPAYRLDPVGIGRDHRVNQIVATYTPEIDRVMNEVVGSLLTDLPRHPRGVESSPLGNQICDIIREHGEADIAFHNRTGIRSGLRKGKVRLRDLYEVSPFHNTIVTMDLTGKEILNLLEYSVRQGSRYFLEVSGLEVVYHPNNVEGERIQIVTHKRKPFQKEKVYRVATNSFLAGGGDGHRTFEAGRHRKNTYVDILNAHRDHFRSRPRLRDPFQNRIHALVK